MSIVKVIEVISEGKSIEAALESAIKEVSKTVKDVRQINVEHVSAIVDKKKITKYRINSKISFVVDTP